MNKWTIEVLSDAVEEEINYLPADIRAKLTRIIELIETFGLENVHEPYIKHIEGKIWEMRMKGRDNIGRALYVTATGRRIVILHAFIKKHKKCQTTGKGAFKGVRDMTKPFDKIADKWKQDPEFKAAYDELEPEFALAHSLIEARIRSGMTQEELADKMGTSQPTIARLESGHKPSLKTLERVAQVTGSKLMIQLVPEEVQQPSPAIDEHDQLFGF